MKTLTKESVPEDLRGTYDFIVNVDATAETVSGRNEIRLLVRKCTLGEAVEVLSREKPDLKVTIMMPVPRQPPWSVQLPCLMVETRAAEKTVLLLDDADRANLLELLKACGYRTDGIEPFTMARGRGWLGGVGLQLERGKPIEAEPDFTFDELVSDVSSWLAQKSAGADRCPECNSTDVVTQNHLRGCKSCGKTTATDA